jgi:hypothetical protein
MADMNNNSGSTSGSILRPAENLTNPRDYEAPSKDNAQTQGSTNVIIKLSPDQIFNNSAQGKGIAGPSVWGGSSESASQSSAGAGTSAGSGGSVDLTTGQNSCWNGGRAYKG